MVRIGERNPVSNTDFGRLPGVTNTGRDSSRGLWTCRVHAGALTMRRQSSPSQFLRCRRFGVGTRGPLAFLPCPASHPPIARASLLSPCSHFDLHCICGWLPSATARRCCRHPPPESPLPPPPSLFDIIHPLCRGVHAFTHHGVPPGLMIGNSCDRSSVVPKAPVARQQTKQLAKRTLFQVGTSCLPIDNISLVFDISILFSWSVTPFPYTSTI